VIRQIVRDYTIKQITSELGLNFKAIHTMIHQVKPWLRRTYSWMSKRNIDCYLSEFSCGINRSQNKETIFHSLITRMVDKDEIYFKYDIIWTPLNHYKIDKINAVTLNK
jgi:hypothetical protein